MHIPYALRLKPAQLVDDAEDALSK